MEEVRWIAARISYTSRDILHQRRRDIELSRENLLKGFTQTFQHRLLQHVAARPCPESRFYVLPARLLCDKNYLRVRERGTDLPRRLYPVKFRHPDVQRNNIWTQARCLCYYGSSIGGRANHLKLRTQ